jgi:hypothetical protein
VSGLESRARELAAMSESDDDPAEENRTMVNIVLAVGFIALVGSGLWLVDAMLDARRADECISAGRRNCIPLDVSPRPQR